MLPFVKGNLDRYFVRSFTILFSFPLSHYKYSHILFLFQEKWHQKEKYRLKFKKAISDAQTEP